MLGPLRVAVVGLGYWGPNLVRNFYELPDVEVACVCDRRPEQLENIRRRYPAISGSTDWTDALEDESIDAIAIATPVGTHYELAAGALDAGKHVFVEKPLAASSREARDLLARAADRRVVLMPGHTFLYSPPVNLVKGLIDSGDLGQIYFISTSRVNLGLHQPDVSVVWDLAPHDFSILRYWLGETPTRVAALSKGFVMPGTPDVAFINLEFESGTIAQVELCRRAPHQSREASCLEAAPDGRSSKSAMPRDIHGRALVDDH